MGRARFGRQLVGLFFILLGCLWLLTIYQRCRIIAPAHHLLPAGGVRAMFSSGGEPGQPFLPPSPKARPWQATGFWVVAGLELICAFLYGAAGIALLRRYPVGPGMGLTALAMDVVYKISVAGYLFLCARPLAEVLAHHRNVLLEYYFPGGQDDLSIAGQLSGLAGYYPRVNLVLLAGYLVVLIGAARILLAERDA